MQLTILCFELSHGRPQLFVGFPTGFQLQLDILVLHIEGFHGELYLDDFVIILGQLLFESGNLFVGFPGWLRQLVIVVGAPLALLAPATGTGQPTAALLEQNLEFIPPIDLNFQPLLTVLELIKQPPSFLEVRIPLLPDSLQPAPQHRPVDFVLLDLVSQDGHLLVFHTGVR